MDKNISKSTQHGLLYKPIWLVCYENTNQWETMSATMEC